ncbi:protein of unknown function [Paenibacillus alvei]|uniref:Uncharacterized protein n=1 Tax=Paenibacillus alvei TaxID=44250 RepID=A0A383R5A8_PAEAL|nr:protein of unknown function [Paenibacillus alvei]
MRSIFRDNSGGSMGSLLQPIAIKLCNPTALISVNLSVDVHQELGGNTYEKTEHQGRVGAAGALSGILSQGSCIQIHFRAYSRPYEYWWSLRTGSQAD